MYMIPLLILYQPDFITDFIEILNKFHKNIKVTYEVEHNGKILFLDVLLMRNNGKLETITFCKEANNNIYLHWRSFAPITWKKGTLRASVRQANCI